MPQTRRTTLLALFTAALSARAQDNTSNPRTPPFPDPDADVKLPNGKSQKDAISKQSHTEALKDVETLISLAEELRDELKRSGQYVVALPSLKKTEDIEKLARRIRGKLKG